LSFCRSAKDTSNTLYFKPSEAISIFKKKTHLKISNNNVTAWRLNISLSLACSNTRLRKYTLPLAVKNK
jgi:hypothetical protein